MTLTEIQKDLTSLKNPEKAKILSRFFKTGKGEYGEGDIFWGITVPEIRIIAKKYKELTLEDSQKLLQSEVHEHRLTALLILTYKFPKAASEEQKQIVDLYLKNTKYINNWDLIDLSAPKIIGAYLLENSKERKILYTLAKSTNLWKKRIAILSTYTLLKQNRFEETLKISEILLQDKHDLIHKGVGWMLREMGKMSQKTEEDFLNKHYKEMPRTMLRYAIEKFSEEKRKFYMQK